MRIHCLVMMMTVTVMHPSRSHVRLVSGHASKCETQAYLAGGLGRQLQHSRGPAGLLFTSGRGNPRKGATALQAGAAGDGKGLRISVHLSTVWRSAEPIAAGCQAPL
jgi:hypothetical protein